MRCYHLCHAYLSDIQKGIQSAHAQMEMFVKYKNPAQSANAPLYDWATNHKTMICLNGGNTAHLMELQTMLSCEDNVYPWSAFYEDSESLNGTITNIAIILPEKIYQTASNIRNKIQMSYDHLDSLTEFDGMIIDDILLKHHLA